MHADGTSAAAETARRRLTVTLAARAGMEPPSWMTEKEVLLSWRLTTGGTKDSDGESDGESALPP